MEKNQSDDQIAVYTNIDGVKKLFKDYNKKELVGTVVNDIIIENKLELPDNYFSQINMSFQDELQQVMNKKPIFYLIIDTKQDFAKVELLDAPPQVGTNNNLHCKDNFNKNNKKGKPSWFKRFLFGDWAYYDKWKLKYEIPKENLVNTTTYENFHANTRGLL